MRHRAKGWSTGEAARWNESEAGLWWVEVEVEVLMNQREWKGNLKILGRRDVRLRRQRGSRAIRRSNALKGRRWLEGTHGEEGGISGSVSDDAGTEAEESEPILVTEEDVFWWWSRDDIFHRTSEVV
jgi:hypothetical protein